MKTRIEVDTVLLGKADLTELSSNALRNVVSEWPREVLECHFRFLVGWVRLIPERRGEER